MAAEIDTRSIATFTATSESSLSALIENPTTDLVKSFLQSIENKVKDYEQSRSHKVKLEVELETVVRTNESKVKVLQNSRDKALADANKLRQDLQNAESSRARVESDLESLQQSIHSDSSEITTLRTRVQSLEVTHRDTLSLLDSKNTQIDRLSQDLSSEHQKVVDLRKQVSTLEQSRQEATSALTSARYKQAGLEQEVELQKKSIDWHEVERKNKNEEHQKFRKEKNARISELQRSIEQHIDQIESLRRTESAVKAQLEDQAARNDELNQQIQRLNEHQIVDAANHRIEIDSLNRLVELQKASADTAKARVQELTTALDEAKDDAAEEIGIIRAEIQEEHNARIAAEQEINRLEARVSELESQLENPISRPGTPRQNANGQVPSTPIRSGTPLASFTPRSAVRLKNGLTTTQLYSEYTKLENELRSERRINAKLQEELESMVTDLESSRPEIEELRSDQARLQGEVFELSSLTEQAQQQRDAALKEFNVLQAQFDQLRKDLNEAQQMIRDRNSQVRKLLLEQQVGSVSDAEYNRMNTELETINAQESEHLSTTQKQVNEHLLAFRNLADLQAINERQLATIRNLAATLESEQAEETLKKYDQLQKDFNQAQSQILAYQDEIKHMVVQSKSFVKERDMFRSMITRRGGQTLPQVDPSDFARSMPTGGFSTSLGGSGENDYAKLLREQQAQFDNYRSELSADHAALKKQVSDLTLRNSEAQAEASRNFGQLTAANQRYEMLQANFNLLKSENAEIQKRSYAAMENATKQELKTQQAAEELIEARSALDSLRRDSANLKAEKDLWKNVEKRLVDDNESLRNERARLDQLNANLQNLLNEKEHSDAEGRRRYQNQVEQLETELQGTKRRLEEQIEENKTTSQRRTYELEQSQKRLDDLVTALSTTREELVAARTAREILQARVDEITVELRSAEERLEVFTKPVSTPAPEMNGADETTVSREQELAVEVSELKRDLDLQRSELTRAEQQIEEYKSIAQAAEERLQQFMDTNEEDKTDLETRLDEKDRRVKDLEQRLEDITAELSTTNSELSKLRDEQTEAARRLEEQKTILQAEIERLRESEEKAREQAQFSLESSKIQAQIAQDAQENYDAELIKHGQAREELTALRAASNKKDLDMIDLRTQAQAARSDLEQKEASWTDMEARYKSEILELQNRREEVLKQNSILHGQLETFTQQIASVQRERAVVSGVGDGTTGNVPDLGTLQEVITYLRREKEIVEVQYGMSQQDAKRLRSQLDLVQSQLEETRLKLSQQQTAGVDLEKSTIEFNRMKENIEQLNLLRESSVTLRAELKQARDSLNERSRRVEELEGQISPLDARVNELEHLLELRQGEMELLQKDRDGWQQRTQHILTKYDRADPAELEALKDRITSLETERDEAVAARDELVVARDEALQARDALQAEVDGHPAAIEAARNTLRDKLSEQFKARNKELTGRIREKQAEADAAEQARAEAQTELKIVRAQLDSATHETPQESDVLPEVNQVGGDAQTHLHDRIVELEASIAEKDMQLQSADTSYKSKENALKDILNKRLAEVKKDAEVAKTAALEELRSSLDAQHQEELESIRSQSIPVAQEVQQTASKADENDEELKIGEPKSFETWVASITEAQARALVQTNTTINNIVKSNIRKGLEKEREQLKQQIAEEQPGISQADIAEKIQEMEKKFAAERESIITQKDEEFQAEKEVLLNQHREISEAEKQALIQQQQQKIEEEVAKAKASTEKMLAMKLNMVQKQNAGNLAKVNVVKAAAEETPDKPVSEVWETAKVAKPPSADAAKPATQATPSQAPQVIATTPAVQEPKAEAAPITNGTSAPASEGEAEEHEDAQEAQASGTAPVPAVRSGLPQPRGRAGFANRGQRGTFQGGQGRGSAIPVPGNATFVNRGRGRGIGRGAASPTRGGAALNPAATQFTPGKRGREDSGDDGNLGKRIRGGGAGS